MRKVKNVILWGLLVLFVLLFVMDFSATWHKDTVTEPNIILKSWYIIVMIMPRVLKYFVGCLVLLGMLISSMFRNTIQYLTGQETNIGRCYRIDSERQFQSIQTEKLIRAGVAERKNKYTNK